MYKTYIDLDTFKEKYEIKQPSFSVNNLLIGTPYMDTLGTSKITNLSRPGEYAEITYYKRGWSKSSY